MPNNGFCEIVNFQTSGESESTHEFTEVNKNEIQECTYCG